jgi:UDPglucose 6-dehydrogenase
MSPKLCILGQDTLAKAVLECCQRHFCASPVIYREADMIWICHDTPIAAGGEPDAEWVIVQIRQALTDWAALDNPAVTHPLILISSQMPVGTIARLEKEYPGHTFACSPENLRVATAVADFENQARVVIGTRNDNHKGLLDAVFAPFTKQIIWTTPETAEMVKHTLNCFLGLQIAFINEIAKIAKVVGADVDTITVGLRTDARVSAKAPLKAGGPFGGGHLARDIYTLRHIAWGMGMKVPIIEHIMESNDAKR